VHLGDNAEARTWARKVNEFVADVVRERPGSFGLFATLTLPDVDGALAEAAYAFDELDADGVVLLTNVAGTYLGDPSFEPLFAELGGRGAVVFVHPAELPAPAVPGIPPFAVDFLLDTTHAALSLIASGTLRRHPRLKVIPSHAGGFLPYAADRVSAIAPLAPALAPAAKLLREFYFDVALSSGPSALPSLLGFADPARITHGSDYPYAPAEIAAAFGHSYERYPIDADLRRAIDRGNAVCTVSSDVLDRAEGVRVAGSAPAPLRDQGCRDPRAAPRSRPVAVASRHAVNCEGQAREVRSIPRLLDHCRRRSSKRSHGVERLRRGV